MQNEINPLIYTKNEYDSTKEYCGKECTILLHSMVGSKGYVHPPPCCNLVVIDLQLKHVATPWVGTIRG
jgi:hypothetical protein